MLGSVGSLASAAGLFLGIVYGIGLIIVSVHLNRYGITSVDLVHARYWVVGFVFLVHVVGTILFSAPIIFFIVLILGPDNSAYVAVPIGVLGFVLLLLASYAPIYFEKKIKRMNKSILDHKTFWHFWRLTTFCCFLLIWYIVVRAIIHEDMIIRTAAIALLSAVLFTSVIYYTIFLYHSPISVGNPILELIGAGRPIKIQLTVDPDKMAGLQKYGIFTTQERISEPLLLLDETSQDLLVLIKFEDKERAVKISKSVVCSVIYLP